VECLWEEAIDRSKVIPGLLVKNVIRKNDDTEIDTNDKTWSLDNADYEKSKDETTTTDKGEKKQKLTMDTMGYKNCCQW